MKILNSKIFIFFAGLLTSCLIFIGLEYLDIDIRNIQIFSEESSTSDQILGEEDKVEKDEQEEQTAIEEGPLVSEPSLHVEDYSIARDSSVYSTLKRAGLENSDIYDITNSAKGIYDLSNIKPGTILQLGFSSELKTADLLQIVFTLSTTDSLLLTKKNEQWSAEMKVKPVELRVVSYQGKVESSFWQSAARVGLDGQAISLLSEIFAWQIDFEREIRPGDSWLMLIEQFYVDDKPYGWGNVLVSEFSRGEDTYRAVRYPQKGDNGEYYSPEGDNLKGKFLKSPLRFSRISSRFQLKRFHPILGVERPHYGVDYAAPRGTPVRAVGDGTINSIGHRGGNGKMIKIKHNSVYQTAYKHLDKFSKGLRSGSKVKQGQIIGHVGSTGLATGPHLHFEFYENGRYTDPLGRKFPREDPIAAQDLADFLKVSELFIQKLNEARETGSNVAISLDVEPKDVSIN